MFQKPLSSIAEADLVALVDSQASETRTLEFKQALPGMKGDDRREFAADVSAFANSLGGDIVYGIRDEDSVAAELVGLEAGSRDGEVLRLTQILRDSIEPRMEFNTHEVLLGSGRWVLIIRVSQGWSGPYRVIAGDNKFYVRHDKGKHPLDVYQLRGAFLRSQLASERMEEFHAMRLIDVAAGRLPTGNVDTDHDAGRVVLHLLPTSAFTSPEYIDRTRLYNSTKELAPLRASGYDRRVTTDGFLTYTVPQSNYTHAYRNGIVEVVEGDILNRESRGKKVAPVRLLETQVVDGTRRYLALLQDLGVSPPVTAFLSLVNAEGREPMITDSDGMWPDNVGPLDRRVLRLPDVTFPTLEAPDVPATLRPAFDVLWNAFGYSRSTSYDEKGTWKQG